MRSKRGRTVPQRAEDNEPTFDWAIGWLARENQIVITPEKRSLRIRLKQEQAKRRAPRRLLVFP